MGRARASPGEVGISVVRSGATRVPSRRGFSRSGLPRLPRLVPRPQLRRRRKQVPCVLQIPGEHATWSNSSQPPPPVVLTYLLYLVLVEFREKAGDHMRGDHPAAASRDRVEKPRLENYRGSGQRRTTALYPGRGVRLGSRTPGVTQRKLTTMAHQVGASCLQKQGSFSYFFSHNY